LRAVLTMLDHMVVIALQGPGHVAEALSSAELWAGSVCRLVVALVFLMRRTRLAASRRPGLPAFTADLELGTSCVLRGCACTCSAGTRTR
jgi:hypothetical protein